jgi:hypothetical protein
VVSKSAVNELKVGRVGSGEERVGHKVWWYPDFTIRYVMRLVVIFPVEGIWSSYAVNRFNGGEESTFRHLSITATDA